MYIKHVNEVVLRRYVGWDKARTKARPLMLPFLSFPGVSFIFYFLCFWFCKATIQEEELQSKKRSTNVELDDDDNDNLMFESTM